MASHPWYIDFRLNNGSIIEVHEREADHLASLDMGCKLEDYKGDKKQVKEPEQTKEEGPKESKAIKEASENKALPLKNKAAKILNKAAKKLE